MSGQRAVESRPDGESLDSWLHQEYAALRRLASVLAPIDVEPDDLLQEALLRMFRSRGLELPEAPRGYLAKTMVSIVRNHQRRQIRGRSALRRRGPSEADARDQYPSDIADLWRLEPIDRALLLLVDLDGHSFREAADELGLSESGARKRASRARRRLAAQLNDTGTETEWGQTRCSKQQPNGAAPAAPTPS